MTFLKEQFHSVYVRQETWAQYRQDMLYSRSAIAPLLSIPLWKNDNKWNIAIAQKAIKKYS